MRPTRPSGIEWCSLLMCKQQGRTGGIATRLYVDSGIGGSSGGDDGAVLVVARSDGRLGPSLRHSDVDCAVLAAEARRAGSPVQATPPAHAQANPCSLSRGVGSISMAGRPISQLANSLSNLVGRLVVDQTGLTGNFDINLKWTPGADDAAFSLPFPSNLDSSWCHKRALLVLVIDRAEHPDEN